MKWRPLSQRPKSVSAPNENRERKRRNNVDNAYWFCMFVVAWSLSSRLPRLLASCRRLIASAIPKSLSVVLWHKHCQPENNYFQVVQLPLPDSSVVELFGRGLPGSFPKQKISPNRKLLAGRPCGHPAKNFCQALRILVEEDQKGYPQKGYPWKGQISPILGHFYTVVSKGNFQKSPWSWISLLWRPFWSFPTWKKALLPRTCHVDVHKKHLSEFSFPINRFRNRRWVILQFMWAILTPRYGFEMFIIDWLMFSS